VGQRLNESERWQVHMAGQETEYMTVAEARDTLGVSKKKIAQLIEAGTLAAEDNPLDKRSKIIKRADVEALRRKVAGTAARKEVA
jgi:excisionase family DNA binding protein